MADMKAARFPDRDHDGPLPTTVPRRLHHLFWNADPAVLRLPQDAAYVASRLLAAPDPTVCGWAVTHLPRSAVAKALSSRSFGPRDQWLLDATAPA